MTMPSSFRDRDQAKFKETQDGETSVRVSQSDSGNILEGLKFDYVSAAYPNNTTEIYTYRDGGSIGPIVATVTVVYTNSSKNQLLNVTRT